jgi:hypothetical protein
MPVESPAEAIWRCQRDPFAFSAVAVGGFRRQQDREQFDFAQCLRAEFGKFPASVFPNFILVPSNE